MKIPGGSQEHGNLREGHQSRSGSHSGPWVTGALPLVVPDRVEDWSQGRLDLEWRDH
jgi:hypothetical protein